MDSRIEVVQDQERGCGWRDKSGSVYLVFRGQAPMPCGKFPLQLTQECECCGNLYYHVVVDGKALKHSLAPRKLSVPVSQIFGEQCVWVDRGKGEACFDCPAGSDYAVPSMLLWVGKEHYPTPQSFLAEVYGNGISRKLPRGLPSWFEMGKTWVYCAHLQAVPIEANIAWNADNKDMDPKPEHHAAIFYAFRPTRAEVICSGTEDEETIDKYVAKGLTPVLVEKVGEAEDE